MRILFLNLRECSNFPYRIKRLLPNQTQRFLFWNHRFENSVLLETAKSVKKAWDSQRTNKPKIQLNCRFGPMRRLLYNSNKNRIALVTPYPWHEFRLRDWVQGRAAERPGSWHGGTAEVCWPSDWGGGSKTPSKTRFNSTPSAWSGH